MQLSIIAKFGNNVIYEPMKRIIKISLLSFMFAVLMVSEVFAVSYWTSLRSTTKSGKSYSVMTMEAKLLWHVTLFTPDFRRAHSKQHAKLEHLSALEAARYAADAEMEQAEFWEFFVIMYTRSDYKQLNMNPDSFWKLRLIAEGKRISPLSIEKLPKTPYYELMFKRINRWSKIYRVIFPKVPLGKRPELVIYSVIDESKLVWDIR